MSFEDFQVLRSNPGKEELKININRKTVTATLTVFSFLDKDTRQHVDYMPSLELSGYGNTEEEAHSMLKQSVVDTFDFFLEKDKKSLDRYLSSLGWKAGGIFKKEYSRVYVDNDGQLQHLNAEGNKVERLTLSAV